MNKKVLFKAVLLFTVSFIISTFFGTYSRAEEIYENPETGYIAVIEDDAGLFTESGTAAFEAEMFALTKYGNVCVKTINENQYASATIYANWYYNKKFGETADGTVFLIDMHYRELVLTSEGNIKQDVTSSLADSIMDNVYKYASDGKYDMCCKKAFSQVNSLMEGKKIAQPMKYICNAFLALILALVINYGIVIIYSRKKKVKFPEFMINTNEKFNIKSINVISKKQYSTGTSSSGGGHSGRSHSSYSSHSHSYHSSGSSRSHSSSHHSSSHHSSGSHRF